MTIESIITNMYWVLILGGFSAWFFGFVEGWVLSKLFNHSGKK